MMVEEQRTSPRIPVNGQVTLALPETGAVMACTLDNVSQSGVRFQAACELSQGSCVELRVASPEGAGAIALQARVVRAVRSACGTMFDYACELEIVEEY